jgi:aryl-alcohol dehydrogenase-like predicted oxidoreductase
MKYHQLGKTDMRVSCLSYGASPLGAAFGPVREEDAIATVHAALDSGINLIDVSPFYGLTQAETLLGKALKTVARDRYYLATKVGRYGHDPRDFDFSAQRVTASVDESLGRMGVDYVDVIQCHDIEFGSLQQVIHETLPALYKLRDSGKVRYVGITGLPLKIFRTVLAQTHVDVILSYCHYSLNDSSLAELIPLLKEKSVGIISASPLSMGLLSDQGPPAWHPAPPDIQAACAKAVAHCQKRGANISKVALQYALANPDIATTLVGTAKPENIRINAQWADEPVDHQLQAEVLEILKPVQGKTWASGRAENN